MSLQPGPAMCSKCSRISHTFISLCLFHLLFGLPSGSLPADFSYLTPASCQYARVTCSGVRLFWKECGPFWRSPRPRVANAPDDIWWCHRLKLPKSPLAVPCSRTLCSSSPQRLRRTPNVISVSTLPPLQSGCFEGD